MGLQNQLNDVSSDSIPLLLLALVAKSIDHLRCLFLSLFHSIGVFRLISPQSVVVDDDLLTSMSSGLANLIVLAEQLNVNRVFSYRYSSSSSGNDDGCGGGDSRGGLDCVVCLCTLRDGDQARKLDCKHVFHKECFDGWLDHLNFNCPVCRTPLVSDERVISTRSHLGEDLLQWFSVR